MSHQFLPAEEAIPLGLWIVTDWFTWELYISFRVGCCFQKRKWGTVFILLMQERSNNKSAYRYLIYSGAVGSERNSHQN